MTSSRAGIAMFKLCKNNEVRVLRNHSWWWWYLVTHWPEGDFQIQVGILDCRVQSLSGRSACRNLPIYSWPRAKSFTAYYTRSVTTHSRPMMLKHVMLQDILFLDILEGIYKCARIWSRLVHSGFTWAYRGTGRFSFTGQKHAYRAPHTEIGNKYMDCDTGFTVT